MIEKYKLKSGDTRWLCKVYLGRDPLTGKEKRTTRRGFRTRKAAMLAEARLIEQGHQQSDNRFKTLSDLTTYYLQVMKPKLKPSTYLVKKSKIDRINTTYGTVKLSKITAANLRAHPLKISHSSFKTLRVVFNFALRREIVDKNPFSLVSAPPLKHFDHDKKYLTPEQVRLIFAYFDRIPATFANIRSKTVLRLAIYSGLRCGEIMALDWSDFDGQSVHVHRTFSTRNRLMSSTPKTASSNRIVSLDSETIDQLKAWQETQAQVNDLVGSVPMFTTDRMRRIDGNTMHTILKALNDNIPELPRLYMHIFRHTHASLLFAAGYDIKTIQTRLGHSSIRTTLDVYTHMMPHQATIDPDRLINFMNNTESNT